MATSLQCPVLETSIESRNNLTIMSGVINCPACGADNMLPEGKTTMYCAFCGKPIEKIISKSGESSIKSKPKISERKVTVHTTRKEGAIGAMHWTGDYSTKRRVDGGFEMYDGLSWKFVPDEIIETEEVIYEGGELLLSNRGVKNLKEIIDWFSDNELSEIKRMDLSGNQIQNLNGIGAFKSLRDLNLSFNKIMHLPSANEISFIDVILLKGSPIEDAFKGDTNKEYFNVSFETVSPCSNCGYNRTPLMEKHFGPLCKSCNREKEKKRKSDEMMKRIINDPDMKKAFAIPESPEIKIKAFLMKAIIIIVVLYLLYSFFK